MAEYSQIKNQTFVFSINQLVSMLKDSNKRFIDEFIMYSKESSFYILPDKTFLKNNEEIGITVFERFYGEKQTNDVRLDFINCFGEKNVPGAYGYAASRYPFPIPYLAKNEFEDIIILNVVARGDLENEFIYELELQKLSNRKIISGLLERGFKFAMLDDE